MFEPGMVLENIEKFHITSMFGVPAMYLFMAQHPDFATRDLSSIRVLSCGGAPVPEALIKVYGARGLPFNQGYGLTETSPFASFLPSSMATEKLGSAGIAPFFTDVKVVDDDGHDVPDGERGEIVVRGPNVMKGYWNRPDATAEVLIDGWFHTGDVGIRDADGYFFIVDRKKDMIITGGENVYPGGGRGRAVPASRHQGGRRHRRAASALGRVGARGGGAQGRRDPHRGGGHRVLTGQAGSIQAAEVGRLHRRAARAIPRARC